MNNSKTVAIVGTQWGDEGKGKLVDAIANNFDIVCRSSGGANAGHTIVANNQTFVFHLLPSCLLREKTIAVIGNGTVVSPQSLITEIDELTASGLDLSGRIKISLRAHLLFEYHQIIDKAQEKGKGSSKIGTTGRGIGPAYADKIARIGIRCEDLLDKELLISKIRENCKNHSEKYNLDLDAEDEINKIMAVRDKIKPLLTDTRKFLQEAIKAEKAVLFEGAQAHHLDLDHGTYPFVTSSNTSIGGVSTGLGVSPKQIGKIIGIVKAYTTRVGSGPFPTELEDKDGKFLQTNGHEFGATTGRPRRCGWFDAVILRESVETNGIDELNLTKLDVLSGLEKIKVATNYFLGETEIFSIPTTPKALKELKITYQEFDGWQEDLSNCKSFDDLPNNAQQYILALEKFCGAKISSIGIGVNREDLIYR